jgi:hypothetical protein
MGPRSLDCQKLSSNDLSKALSHNCGSQAFYVSRWSSRKVKVGPRSLGGKKLSGNDLSKALSHKSGSQAFWFSRRSSREMMMGLRPLVWVKLPLLLPALGPARWKKFAKAAMKGIGSRDRINFFWQQ